VIDALRERGCVYYVAPYEADSQFAMLSFKGVIDAVFSIDTDLVALCRSETAKTFLTVSYSTGYATLVAREALFVEREGTHSHRTLSRRATRIHRGSAPEVSCRDM